VQRLVDKGRALTLGTWLKSILVMQVVIAGLLIAVDISTRWSFDAGSDEPSLDAPVSPGDQVRRYEPTRPDDADPGSGPDIDLPDDFPPRLRFTLRADPDLGDLLVLHGEIADGDAGRLDAYLSGLEARPDEVAIDSPGGLVAEALQIGTLIREQEFETRILPGTICLSSCPYVLAGGVDRRVAATGVVGLHQHYYEAPGYMPVFLAVENIQRGQGRTMRYLIDMGVDPGVMIHSLATPPNDIYVLVEEELLESRLATEVSD
jgi:hypothetical protein